MCLDSPLKDRDDQTHEHYPEVSAQDACLGQQRGGHREGSHENHSFKEGKENWQAIFLQISINP